MGKCITFLILLSLFFWPFIGRAEKFEIIPKAYLILPENTEVKLSWMILPSRDEKPVNVLNDKSFGFCVDSRNKPLISLKASILMNILSNSIIKIEKPFTKMICTESGLVLFVDEEKLYVAELKDSKNKKILEAKLKPLINLPLKGSRIFTGSRNIVFIVASSISKGQSEVYQLAEDAPGFIKSAAFDFMIDTLTGTGNKLFISKGRQVYQFSKGQLSLLYEYPREDILEHLYSEKSGLFYRTAHAIGFIKDGNALEFLQLESPYVFLKEKSLYVFLSKNFGLFKLEDIDDLQKYSYGVDKIIDIKKLID